MLAKYAGTVWIFTGAVVAVAVSFASTGVTLSPADFSMARFGFGTAAILLGAATIYTFLGATWPLRKRASVAIALCAVIGILFHAAQSWVSRREALARNTAGATITARAFTAKVRTAQVYDGSGPLALYMVVYNSLYGRTASPVFYLMNIAVTNHADVPSTVEAYSVSVSPRPEGPWTELVPIPLSRSDLFATGVTPSPGGGHGGIVVFPRGASRLGAATQADMKNAALLKPDAIFDEELTRTVDPHRTITGWAAFDAPNKRVKGGHFFRITLRDAAGTAHEVVCDLPKRPSASEADLHPGRIQVAGIADISSAHVRYYSDPY